MCDPKVFSAFLRMYHSIVCQLLYNVENVIICDF